MIRRLEGAMTTRATERQIRIVQCLEALYAWEREDEDWLRASMNAIGALWEHRVWTWGILYDASKADDFVVQKLLFNDEAPEALQGIFIETFSAFPPSFVAKTYRSLTIGFGRAVGSELEPFYQRLEPYGTADIFGVNGLDPSNLGCFVGIAAPPSALMSPQTLIDFQRISSHLASAYRCRRRLHASKIPAIEQAEVVALPDGTIVEAKGPAEPRRVREALSSDIRAIQEVRKLDGSQPETRWLPRLQGRWTLVEGDGKDRSRYVLARENLSAVPALAQLTERELQVVATLSLGRTIKETAYDLGISDSTVRVLLTRVYARLGIRSYEQLLNLPAVRALREGRPALPVPGA
jgi:DNA-binding CsgD family transcriptional regulator